MTDRSDRVHSLQWAMVIVSLLILFLASPAMALAAETTMDLWIGSAKRSIHHGQIDAESGRLLGEPRLVAEDCDARELALTPDGRFLYATGTGRSEGDGPNEVVSAFAVAADGSLRLLGRQPSGGRTACFLSVAPDRSAVFVAHFRHDSLDSRGSIAVLPIAADGSLAAPRWWLQHPGQGAVLPRQAVSHPHSILPSPDGRLVAIGDLGLDRILVYRSDPSAGVFERVAPDGFVAEPGAMPRHVAFHPTLPLLYANEEGAAALSAYSLAEDGFGTRLQTIASTRPGVGRNAAPSDLHIDPQGRFLFSALRVADEIAIHPLAADGTIGAPAWFAPHALKRLFAISPDGRWLVVPGAERGSLAIAKAPGAGGDLSVTSMCSVPGVQSVMFGADSSSSR